MDSDALMFNKLVILYMLDRLEMPISNAELTRIILEKKIAQYITIQEALCDLVSDNYITESDNHNSHLYAITDEGRETLSFFYQDLSVQLRDEIDECLTKEMYHLRDLAASTADYYESNKNEYIVELKVVERGSELVNIKLLVASSEEADTICNRWKEANADVYGYLISRLLAGKKEDRKEDKGKE